MPEDNNINLKRKEYKRKLLQCWHSTVPYPYSYAKTNNITLFGSLPISVWHERTLNQGFSKWVTGHPGVPWRQSRGDATYFDNIWNLYGHLNILNHFNHLNPSLSSQKSLSRPLVAKETSGNLEHILCAGSDVRTETERNAPFPIWAWWCSPLNGPKSKFSKSCCCCNRAAPSDVI